MAGHLLLHPDVVRELKLTDEQRQQLSQLTVPHPGGAGQHRGPGGPGGPPPGGPGQRGPAGPGLMDKQIQQYLSPEQFRRWKQIELQVQAPMSIGRPDVAERLNLSEAQRRQIHELHMEMRPPAPPQGQERPTREQMEKMHQEMMGRREELLRKVLGVLTSEQRRQWDAMTGKPFKLSPPQRRPEQG